MRPLKGYYCHSDLPSLGSYVDVPAYKKHGKNIREDYFNLVSEFAKKYNCGRKIINSYGGCSCSFNSATSSLTTPNWISNFYNSTNSH